MNLKHFSNQELIARMEKLVRTERKITHLILDHIAEIEERRLYAELGFDGMYSYLTKGCGYSDGAAYRRLQSARLLRRLPEVAEKIEEGRLNLTQLTQVQKCLKESAKKGEALSSSKTVDILSQIENKSFFETQKTLATELNLPAHHHERILPQKDDSVLMEITLSAGQFAELETAKSLLSHICPDGSWAEVIVTLASRFNKQKLAGLKSQLPAKELNESAQCSTQVVVVTKADKLETPKTQRRSAISVRVKRALLNKSLNCCEYVDSVTGRSCRSQYQLQVDHIQPLALAGTNDQSNLRILCRTHNILMAQKAGLSRMQNTGAQRTV